MRVASVMRGQVAGEETPRPCSPPNCNSFAKSKGGQCRFAAKPGFHTSGIASPASLAVTPFHLWSAPSTGPNKPQGVRAGVLKGEKMTTIRTRLGSRLLFAAASLAILAACSPRNASRPGRARSRRRHSRPTRRPGPPPPSPTRPRSASPPKASPRSMHACAKSVADGDVAGMVYILGKGGDIAAFKCLRRPVRRSEDRHADDQGLASSASTRCRSRSPASP